jgi:hypothetical protein
MALSVILKFLARFLKGLAMIVLGGLFGLAMVVHMLLANHLPMLSPP